MINVSELIADPDFAQLNGINIVRSTYTIVDHEPVIVEESLVYEGIITIQNDKSTQLLPEADRNTEEIHVFTKKPLYTTGRSDDDSSSNYISDIVIWQGVHYKVESSLDDVQYGFNRATCSKMRQDVM